MIAEEIEQLIREIQVQQCELDDVEVKAAHQGTPSRLYDSFSALANRSGGGVLLFGIDENVHFAVTGVHDANRLIADVAGKATDEMEPPLRLLFFTAEIDGHTVVAAEVPEVPIEQKPCYHKFAGLQRGSYLRVGESDRLMTDYEIFGFVSNRVQQDYDRALVADATLDDLDHDRLEAYLDVLRAANSEAPYLRQSFEQVLKTLRIVRDDQGVLRPTMAGLLTFGIYPQSFEPQLVITFLQYFGSSEYEPAPNGARFLDNKKFEGAIPAMVNAAYNYILKTLRKSTLVSGLYHQEIPEYPSVAVREALVNAVMHRDYSPYARGSYIQVRLFADRLVIESPGGLYGSVTVETIAELQSTRNRQLMRFAEDLQMVENRGSGINTMLDEMHKATLEPPIFDDSRSTFRVTFYNRHLLEPETQKWLNAFAAHKFSEQQLMALAYLHHREKITNSEYQRLNFVDKSTATRELRGLVQAGVAVQQASRCWRYYKLADAESEENVQLPLVSQLSSDEEAVLAYIRENDSIDNKTCRDLLHIDREQAKRLIKGMVVKNLIHQIGEVGRFVRYKIN